ncbi:MAG: fumarate hydratase C-terminal domain-containing protein [Clostridia bacterium]|nr:fumarate hydratase C-terminal domain-containing protein [Clostridia bacterium]
MIEITFPIADRKELEKLKIGDRVLLNGEIYTARDAAHKRLVALIESGKELPISLKDIAVYYTGPCPAPKGRPIGSCGPTTSGRMDAYAPLLLDCGQAVMIGKGERNQAVIDACKRNKAVYLAAAGGAGALLADCVKECTVVAFDELLSEAIHKLKVEKMPLIVAIDACGNDIFSLREYK